MPGVQACMKVIAVAKDGNRHVRSSPPLPPDHPRKETSAAAIPSGASGSGMLGSQITHELGDALALAEVDFFVATQVIEQRAWV